jgi:CBS-domain-containing membrane protein
MTRFVVCVKPDTPIKSVRAILADTDAPCAPVLTDEGVLAGIVTHAQLLQAGQATLAAEVMASSVIGIPEDAPLAHAMATMAQAGVLALPVLAGDGAVVGAIGALDTLRFIVKRWGYETG